MNKTEFLHKLEKELSKLSPNERKEHINFYSEMIEDRIEEGSSEEDAVSQIGTIEEIVSQIVVNKYYSENDISMASKTKTSKSGWAIVLFWVGSPLWLTIAIAVFAVILSIYATIWSVVAAIWSCFAAFALAGPMSVIAGIPYAIFIHATSGLVLVSAGLVLSGLAILAFFGCLYATKWCAALTALVFKYVINICSGKEKRNA